MIQDKILHAQFLRQFSGIKRRTVAFLIRLERIAVCIETKRLTHHPVSPHYVASVLLVIRFITQARQDQRLIRFIRRRQLCSESELFFLSRLNIKAFQLHIPHFEAIAIFQLMEHHPFSHLSQLLLGKNHVDDGLDHLYHLIVSIHMQQSLISLTLCHHSDYPDSPQHMVGMRMGNEEVMNVRNLNMYLLQLRQYSVSSARIHQHQGAGSLEHKTGIINLGNRSISRSEHRNLSRCLIHCLIRYLFDSRPQNYSFSDKPPRKSPKNFAYSK